MEASNSGKECKVQALSDGKESIKELIDPPRYTNVRMPFDVLYPHVPLDNPTGVYRLEFGLDVAWIQGTAFGGSTNSEGKSEASGGNTNKTSETNGTSNERQRVINFLFLTDHNLSFYLHFVS